MIEWMKEILGDAYTEDIDNKITARLTADYAPKADLEAANTAKSEAEAALAAANDKYKDVDIDALRAECLAMLEPTRKEAGCVRYELLANIANPAEFTFVEEWADQAAIDAHMATAHLKGLVANTQALLAEPLDVRLYTLA